VHGRPWLATVGLVVLALLAGGLSYLALTTTKTTSSPLPTPSATPGTSASSSPHASLTALTANAAAALALASPTQAWRASAGNCTTPTSSMVNFTSDGGAMWTAVSNPGLQVLGFAAASADGVTAIGLDASCRMRSTVTTDGGQTWSAATATRGVWALDPAKPTSTPNADSPSAQPSGPCQGGTVVAVDAVVAAQATDALLPATAYVVCSDGAVLRTTDGGATYVKQSTVPAAAAIATNSDGSTYLAVTGVAGCVGVSVQASGDDGSTWNPVSCVADATDLDPIALDAFGSTVMLRAGGTTYLSADDAASWFRSSG